MLYCWRCPGSWRKQYSALRPWDMRSFELKLGEKKQKGKIRYFCNCYWGWFMQPIYSSGMGFSFMCGWFIEEYNIYLSFRGSILVRSILSVSYQSKSSSCRLTVFRGHFTDPMLEAECPEGAKTFTLIVTLSFLMICDNPAQMTFTLVPKQMLRLLFWQLAPNLLGLNTTHTVLTIVVSVCDKFSLSCLRWAGVCH